MNKHVIIKRVGGESLVGQIIGTYGRTYIVKTHVGTFHVFGFQIRNV